MSSSNAVALLGFRPEAQRRDRCAIAPRMVDGEGHEETQIPRNGLGMSDGRGTFKHYKEVRKARTLKFGRRRAYV